MLHKYYFDLSFPGAYKGKAGFKKALLQKGVKVNNKEVNDFLAKTSSYTKFKHLLRKFPKRKILTFFPGHMVEADLMTIGKKMLPHNKPVKFILIIIDSFTRFLWAYPLPNKQAETVMVAFNKFLNEEIIPNIIYLDKGNEWGKLKSLAKAYSFQIWSANSDDKAAISERAIQSLRRVISRFLDHQNTFHFVSILPEIVKAYNSSYHRAIKTSPIEAQTAQNRLIFKNIYGRKTFRNIVVKKKKTDFHENDLVRISRLRPVFEKKTMSQTATGEIFRIAKVLFRGGFRIYKVADLNGEVLPGTFYEQQLVRVLRDANEPYIIEKILRRRVRNGKRELFVKWKDFPRQFNSWIDASEVT